MDPKTGEVFDAKEWAKMFTTDKERAKSLIPIPPEEEKSVRAMNRHERRKWAAERKRKR